MKNYQIEDKSGMKFWISRSMAVAAFIFCQGDLDETKGPEEVFILAVKRGKGSSTFPGLWCAPCGYVERDETIPEACIREVFEETNLVLGVSDLSLLNIDDDPKSFNQDVTFEFASVVSTEISLMASVGTGGEKDEIEEVKWIRCSELDQYEWAFGHDEIIKNLF